MPGRFGELGTLALSGRRSVERHPALLMLLCDYLFFQYFQHENEYFSTFTQQGILVRKARERQLTRDRASPVLIDRLD